MERAISADVACESNISPAESLIFARTVVEQAVEETDATATRRDDSEGQAMSNQDPQALASGARRAAQDADDTETSYSTEVSGGECYNVWEAPTTTARLQQLARSSRQAPGESSEQGEKDSPRTAVTSQYISASRAFRRLCPEGRASLPHELLSAGLQLIGHWCPDTKLMQSIRGIELGGRDCLDLDDFVKFIRCYEKQIVQSMKAIFSAADYDDSGTISAAELSGLLKGQSIYPIPGLVEELMRDVAGEGSLSSTMGATIHRGQITFEEYMRLQDMIRHQAGFTRREALVMQEMFRRHDRDGDGQINKAELCAALGWLSLPSDPDLIAELTRVVDPDDSGLFTEGEFLVIMQRYRQQEVRRILEAFSAMDMDKSGSIDATELPGIFEMLGYIVASPELIEESRQACPGDLAGKDELLFEDIYVLLATFRDKHGFLDAEVEELRSAYELRCNTVTGSVGLVEAARVIQWLGFAPTAEDLAEIFDDFDIDLDGELDFREFLKLVSMYREAEIRSIRSLFARRGAHLYKDTVPIECLDGVLQELGYKLELETFHEFKADVCAEANMSSFAFWDFARVVWRYRSEWGKSVRSCLWFPSSLISRFKNRFHKYDLKRSGLVSGQRFKGLVDELIPRCRHREIRLKEILEDVEESNAGSSTISVDFPRFLKLMRHSQDRADGRYLAKERQARRELGFQTEEVKEFKAIFQAFDTSGVGELSLADFRRLVSSIVPIEDARAEVELAAIMSAVSEDREQLLDFPEFLRAIKKLQDENWHNINGTAADIVQQQQ